MSTEKEIKNEYHIERIDYRDIYGNLLWSEKMIFKCLYAIGQTFIYDHVEYIVKRVAVADDTQHVNIESL